LSRIVRALMAMIVVLALAGVAGAGTMTVMRARNDAQSRVTAAARERARNIATVVRDAVQADLTAVVDSTRVQSVSLAVARHQYPAATPFLIELALTHPRFVSAGIYTTHGVLVARVPSDLTVMGRRFGQQEYFTKASAGSASISSLFVQLGKPRVAVIAYSVGFRHRGTVRAVLVATSPISALDSLVAPYVPPGAVARIYNETGERISPSSEASGKTYSTDPTIASALAGRSSIHRAGGQLTVAQPVADLGWAVVVSEPARSADRAVHKLTVRLSWLTGGATFLALLAAVAASARSRRREQS
jgi:hypothetical protein